MADEPHSILQVERRRRKGHRKSEVEHRVDHPAVPDQAEPQQPGGGLCLVGAVYFIFRN